MSYALSPRPVCSITIGTSIICASLDLKLEPDPELEFTLAFPHSRPEVVSAARGRIEMVRVRRTVYTKIRGSSRCGFCFVSYRGPHPVSNKRVLLPTSVWIVWPALPALDSVLRR